MCIVGGDPGGGGRQEILRDIGDIDSEDFHANKLPLYHFALSDASATTLPTHFLGGCIALILSCS